jgi:hypothetical protein
MAGQKTANEDENFE